MLAHMSSTPPALPGCRSREVNSTNRRAPAPVAHCALGAAQTSVRHPTTKASRCWSIQPTHHYASTFSLEFKFWRTVKLSGELILTDGCEMAWAIILKFAGEKLGKEIVGALIDKFGGDDASSLKASILGEDDDKVQKHLRDIEGRLTEIKEILEDVELGQVFCRYNEAHKAIAAMRAAFAAHRNKPKQDKNRENACRDILSENGVLKRARSMITEIIEADFGKRSVLFQYSDIILRKEKDIDVFRYCDRVKALVSHLKMDLLIATTLREMCAKDLNEPESIKDIEIGDEDITDIDNHFKEVIRPIDAIRALFDHAASDTSCYVRLQHYASGTYLTGYGPGVALSDDEPFGSYFNLNAPYSDQGMPQVFVHPRATGQVEINKQAVGYLEALGGSEALAGKLVAGTLEPSLERSIQNWLVKLEPHLQQWRVVQKREGDETVVMLVHMKSGQALAGITQNRIYLIPFDPENTSTWWQPVLTQDDGKTKKYDGIVIMLKHWGDRRALDANGSCVYSGNRTVDHGNRWMQWRVEEGKTELAAGGGSMPTPSGRQQ